ncbi:hypothetical protein MASR2M15_10290 [Anaerolineales bacterium]
MLNRDARWRSSLRNWFRKNKTAQSFLMMLKSKAFYKEIYNLPKLYQLIRIFPYTLVAYPGLSGLYDLSKKLNQDHIEGAFVECGVWRGGCAIILSTWAQKQKRAVHLFDSFEGLPEPLPIDGKRALKISKGKESGTLASIGHIVVSIEEVEDTLFKRFAFDRNQVHLHKGWFQDTLPQVSPTIGKIALLRLDGDWYESTKVCLEYLYDQVVEGGYVVIDDYQEFDGCRLATDEFLQKQGIKPELHHFDWFGGTYFQKRTPTH